MNRHLFVFALCGTVGLTAACGSGSKPVGVLGTGGVSGTGGIAGTGGVSGTGGIAGSGGVSGTGGIAGSGGIAGTGGVSGTGGIAGSGGIAGTGGPSGCNASNTDLAPPSGQIANFMGGAGANIPGGVYSLPPGVPFTTTGGSLHISTAGFFVVYFDHCIDATAFSGVQFSISGSSSGCTIEYKAEDSLQLQILPPMFGAGHGTCSGSPGPCGGQAATITAAQITALPQTLRMPFVGGPFAGSPKMPIDKTKLVQVLWALYDNPSCVADITVDDIKFY